MRRLSFLVTLCVVACALIILRASAATARPPLQIYFIDVEGGQSTLIVDALGESLLVDTGWGGFNNRDANRIVAAAKAAGIQQIDYLLITHFHTDHVGGVPQLAGMIKIGTYVDHGPNMEDSDITRKDYAAYMKVVDDNKHIIAKPGDKIPFKGMDVQVLSAAGDLITNPLPGAGQPNPVCASEPPGPADATENLRSVGTLITVGKFRFIDLGDLVKIKERGLVCPNNLIGTVDLYLTTHHGLNQSNSKVIVDALHPRVAIMNNGARKGGSPEAWQTVHDSPGLQDLWQLHYSVEGAAAHNVAEKFIANPDEKNDVGNYIKVVAQRSGNFTVINTGNKFQKTYTK
jgi:beta-lactamase superfamily II metal-dependent hydrolase